MPNYEKLMLQAVELAKQGAGYVSPNPLVGAIILRDGEIVSQGFHSKFGGIHSEIDAIKKSKLNNFEDCELIVNLEPCSHTGKQPPCTDEIIKRKFKKVIIGMQDPNPLVNGAGIKKLQENNIEVITDVCKKECEYLNRFFIKNVTQNKPYIILKMATSLDGFISTITGKNQWITCEESRKDVHKLRSETDAILVGRNTLLMDNPRLDVRLVPGRSPKRLVLDTNLKLPLELYVFVDPNRSNTFVLHSAEHSCTRKANTLTMSDVNLIPVEVNEKGKLDLGNMLSVLYEKHQIGSILVEGGAKVITSFIDYDLADEMIIYQAPLLFGSGLKFFESNKIKDLNSALKFEYLNSEKSGADMKLTLKRK